MQEQPAVFILFAASLTVFIIAFRGWRTTGSQTAIISGGIGALLILLSAVMKAKGIVTPPPFLLPLAVSITFAGRGFSARKKMETKPALRPVVSIIMQIAVISLIAAVVAAVL